MALQAHEKGRQASAQSVGSVCLFQKRLLRTLQPWILLKEKQPKEPHGAYCTRVVPPPPHRKEREHCTRVVPPPPKHGERQHCMGGGLPPHL